MPKHAICTDPQGYAICARCLKNPDHYDQIEVMHPHQEREKPNAWDGRCLSWKHEREASRG
jgi:hypothetical protein